MITWIALVLVPPGCALALGWAAHGARPWLALAVVPILAFALAVAGRPAGRVAQAGADRRARCVTLGQAARGRRAAARTEGRRRRDDGDRLGVHLRRLLRSEQNATFNAAAPAPSTCRASRSLTSGTPRPTTATTSSPGLVGGILAAERRPQALLALATLIVGRGVEPALPRRRLAARHGAALRRAAGVRDLAPPACQGGGVTPRVRVVGRRVVVLAVVLLQVGFVARAYWSDHKEFGVPDVPRVEHLAGRRGAGDRRRPARPGRACPGPATAGRSWCGTAGSAIRSSATTRTPGSTTSSRSSDAALDWVAGNTPRDRETRYLEARVTAWHNADRPQVRVLRSRVREGAG